MRLLWTTNPGLEDVVEAELRERLTRIDEPVVTQRPDDLAGHVRSDHAPSLETLWPIAQRMRSVHHVLLPIDRFALDEAEPLAGIAARLAELEIPQMREARTFRITTNRYGEHGFSSMDVQREAGAVVVEKYGAGVDLKGYEVNVRVDVIGGDCLVGVQLTRQSLSKRYPRLYNPRAALKPTVAYTLLRMADLPESFEGPLLDPFCGAGTVLLEAGQLWPNGALYGSDNDPKAVEGAAQNAGAVGLAERLDLRCADARDLVETYGEARFAAVVTNPPYGVRVGKRTNFSRLYRKFLRAAHGVLRPGGRLVMLVFKNRAFRRVLDELGGYEVRAVRIIETGGLYPRIYALEALPGPLHNAGGNAWHPGHREAAAPAEEPPEANDG